MTTMYSAKNVEQIEPRFSNTVDTIDCTVLSESTKLKPNSYSFQLEKNV